MEPVIAPLTFAILNAVVRFLAVYSENSGLALGKRDFLRWMVIYWVAAGLIFSLAMTPVTILLNAVLSISHDPHFFANIFQHILAAIWIAFSAVVNWLFMWRVVRRARMADMGMTVAYLSVIPGINMLTTLILTFNRDALDDDEDDDNDISYHTTQPPQGRP